MMRLYTVSSTFTGSDAQSVGSWRFDRRAAVMVANCSVTGT